MMHSVTSPGSLSRVDLGNAPADQPYSMGPGLQQWLLHIYAGPRNADRVSITASPLYAHTNRAPPVPDNEGHTHQGPAIYQKPQRGKCTLDHISHFPVEILCEIFVHCLPDGMYSDRYLSPRVDDAPILLCHICSHWRQVAFSLPALWSSFSGGSHDFHRGRRSPNTFALVDFFLARSQSHPVSVEFDLHTSRSVRKLLIANSHRWESASIDPNDEVVKELLAIPPGIAMTMERLSLDIGYECEETLQDIPSILPLFPNLRRLSFVSFDTPRSLFSHIPWSDLTHIQLRCEMSLDECIMYFGLCRLAEHIEIHGRGIDFSSSVDSSRVTLPRLRDLRVNISGDIGTLLDRFTLPSLRSLRYTSGTMGSKYRNYRALEDFAKRSACVLETLLINDRVLLESEDDLLGYLHLPCLRSLRNLEIVSFDELGDRTLALLLYPTSAVKESVLPRLEELTLKSLRLKHDRFTVWAFPRPKFTGISSPLNFQQAESLHPRMILTSRIFASPRNVERVPLGRDTRDFLRKFI